MWVGLALHASPMNSSPADLWGDSPQPVDQPGGYRHGDVGAAAPPLVAGGITVVGAPIALSVAPFSSLRVIGSADVLAGAVGIVLGIKSGAISRRRSGSVQGRAWALIGVLLGAVTVLLGLAIVVLDMALSCLGSLTW